MIQVTNTNSQLKITSSTLIEYYKYETFKGISWALDSKGYYVVINFIANDKNNSLRLYLVDIDNQGSWTNDVAGANNAVNTISTWMSSASISPSSKTPKILRVSSTSGTISSDVNSISISSVGTASAFITVNGSTVELKKGETISYDAGAIDNYFPGGYFSYDTVTNAGSELLIIYVTL